MKRRNFIEKTVYTLPALGIWVSSCQSKSTSEEKNSKVNIDPCKDLSGVSDNDLKTRKKLGYVEVSPQAESQCSNCNLWLPPKEQKTCGGCMLFKGPVEATGYCTYWVPQSK
ncbi:high-potential iron-sulfur protein [Runella zeae]|uniref:high-potential iron-sulfur protein n=1 Tax=Runella zeae TaxID=94255 RepID=UPI0003FAD744|nr:high-potential iron-sulfur protein [Runella zeae]